MNIIPKPHQRILIMSDLHGNNALFKKILKEMNFSTDDMLIINGDMSEKGDDSIGLFRSIIKLKQTHHVYATLGNCDELLLFLNDDTRDKGMEHYMMTREKTILSEFKKALGHDSDFRSLKLFAKEHFGDIFSFVEQLPLSIDTPSFTVVHAGINPLDPNDRDYCLKTPAFLSHDFRFDKPVIVGHYPVCLYHTSDISHDSILNSDKNIFAIDGGNNIKIEGQINVLEVIDDHFTSHRFDALDYVSLNITQEAKSGIHISWLDRSIQILEARGDFSLCKHINSDTLVEIPNRFLDLDTGELISDYTNALVEVKKNDVVHIVLETSLAYYVKCRGSVGWLLK